MVLFGGQAVITGVGQSDVGRRLERSGLDLAVQACLDAVADSGLSVGDIDGIATYPGADNTAPGFAGASAAQVIDALGLQVTWYTGASESSGQLGPVVDACMAVASGLSTHVLCFRAVTESTAQGRLGRRSVVTRGPVGEREPDRWGEWSAPFGAVASPNVFAMLTQSYMHEFGLTREQLAQIALTDRTNAAWNPTAVYREPMTLDDYLNVRMISSPLCLYDCDVPVDGATAVLVSRADAARNLRYEPLRVDSVGTGIRGRYSLDQCADLTRTAAHDCGDALWSRTHLKPSDVAVAELYDGFSILTLTWLEALGFCGRGEAGGFVDGGDRIGLGGELPLNTHGGQLSAGRLHGMGFLHEACIQLWGRGGQRQVAGSPRVAVAAAGGGPFCGCLLMVRD